VCSGDCKVCKKEIWQQKQTRELKEVSAVTVINLCFFHDHLKLVEVPSEEKMNKRRRKRRNEGRQRF
jgi:hypothetical protein